MQDDYNRTSLLLAANRGHTEICKSLIERGAALNVQDNFQKTALEVAAEGRHTEIALSLLAAGATPDIPNRGGMNALM